MSALAVILLVALAGGFAIAAQAQLSALMIDEVGPLGTVFLTYGVGAVAATALVVVTRGGRLAGVRALPPYVYLAGILGLVIVGTVSYSVAQVGVVEGLLLITVAQFVVSALIDHFGLLGAEVQPLTPAKVAGILLLLGGGWLALR